MKIQGTWIIPLRSTGVPPYQTRCKWARTASRTRYNKKISKKKIVFVDYGKSRTLVARQHFSMMLLWRQLHREFLRFVNWTRPSGWRGNFYQVTQGQLLAVIMRSFDCWEPQLSKKYRVDRGFHNISGSTIFKLFKSRWVPGCTAAGRIP